MIKKALKVRFSDVNWVNAGSLSAGAAAQVAVTSTNSGSHFLSFVDSVTGNEDIRANSSLTYNTATQVITGRISSIDNHNTCTHARFDPQKRTFDFCHML